jgi:hypothetical protein
MREQVANLYSFSGVVHRLSRSVVICSTAQPVSNAVAMRNSISIPGRISFRYSFGFGSGTNMKPARSTSLAQHLDRSRNPIADTHSQVPTANVSPYTACAPRSSKA